MYSFSRVSKRFCASVGVFSFSSMHIYCDPEKTNAESCKANSPKKSSVLFLGTGSSAGTPNPYFLMKPESYFLGADPNIIEGHKVSRKAAKGDPADNKNYRCNPSVLIRYRGNTDEIEKNILIDCGKTFREAAIRWFPRNGVESVDAVLLSHGHADAIFGLDDIRGVQDRIIKEALPVHLSNDCFSVIKKSLGYLVKDDQPALRTVSNLKWVVIPPYKIINVLGLDVLPIDVMHGEDMTSFGFIFGEKHRVCYISDISRMLPQTMDIIMSKQVDTLVVDSLFKNRGYFSHYSLPQALDLIRLIKPRKAYLIGMSSDTDHETTNDQLRKLLLEEGLDVELSFDGLSLELDL